MDPLADIAVFVRVVEHGSFTAAAEALELSKAAVSKAVTRLEQRLGARLLHRTTRRLALTEAGETLHGRGAAALAELVEAENDVAQLTGAPRGLLRVSAPTYLGSVRLAPALKDFRARYPDVTLDLHLDDRLVDLVRERFDVAVRIAPSLDPSLVARRLATCPLIFVAAPSYLRRHGAPRVPADLAAHEGLGYSLTKMPNRWRMREPRGRWVEVSMKSTLRSNNDFVLRQAAVDGLGLAMFPDFFVERELADGRLVPVLAECRTPELSVSAVYASRRNVPPKLRVFVDFLGERFGEAPAARSHRGPR
jgi:DNA-binding transcriptional LysR family regulator